MTFESYPRLVGDNADEVIGEIIESRDDDITTFDEMVRRANTGAIFDTQAQQTTAALQVGDGDGAIDVDASGGVVTITFEAAPTNGQIHLVSKEDASANAVTVDGNGKNINGAGTDSLPNQYDSAIYVFIGAADEWRTF